MEKKLKQYQDIKKELEQIKEKILELQERKTSIKSMVISDMNVQTSHNNCTIDDLLIKIEEMIQKYHEKELELFNKQLDIESSIEKLDTLERSVLRYRYIDGLRFEEISCKIKYSYRTVRRIHKRSIEKKKKNSKMDT